ncbi:hypothetical protein TRIUR3_20445 [Triticum urartu]|uniref:Uncharacterized protein n=1 Tax=Triticum urartu TaxID=4572 RepID=M7YI06_TRIUA|nr:hypothetical protein TRIUR3_20445 [Triticum urartu]
MASSPTRESSDHLRTAMGQEPWLESAHLLVVLRIKKIILLMHLGRIKPSLKPFCMETYKVGFSNWFFMLPRPFSPVALILLILVGPVGFNLDSIHVHVHVGHCVVVLEYGMRLGGPQAYCDATFNPSVAGIVAGLGVLLHNPSTYGARFVQATTFHIGSALQGEAPALGLAVMLQMPSPF